MPTDVQIIAKENIKMRWKETYVSEGINKRGVGVFTPGVYRGLGLSTNGADLSVTLTAEPSSSDHVAVYESSDGFLTFYRQEVGDLTLDLDLFAGTPTEVVIALFINYEVGIDTTAAIRVFTVAEYDALSAADRDELVVAGTVSVPAAGAIDAADITLDRRSLPWTSESSSSTPWNPVVRNGGFEISETGDIGVFASPFWDVVINNQGIEFKAVETESVSGSKSLEINAFSAGNLLGIIKQDIGVQVLEGQAIRFKAYKKVITIPAGGFGLGFELNFDDKDGAALSSVDIAVDVSGVDGSFVAVETIVNVPAGAAMFRNVRILHGQNPGLIGPVVRIDDIQAWIEPVSGEEWLPSESRRAGEVSATRLMLGDESNSFADDAAKLSYDGSTITVERKDQDSDKVRPGFSWPAPSTEVAADAPVVSVAVGVAVGIEYTLVHESIPDSEKGFRIYVDPTGGVAKTVNASYDNTTGDWSKDVPGEVATKLFLSNLKMELSSVDTGTATWDDASWDQVPLDMDAVTGSRLITPSFTGDRSLVWEMDHPTGTASRTRMYRGTDSAINAIEWVVNAKWQPGSSDWLPDTTDTTVEFTKVVLCDDALVFYRVFNPGTGAAFSDTLFNEIVRIGSSPGGGLNQTCTQIGKDLVSGDFDADSIPRLRLPVYTTGAATGAVIRRVLIEEYTEGFSYTTRKYIVSEDAGTIEHHGIDLSMNARWSNSTQLWVADDTAVDASLFRFEDTTTGPRYAMYKQQDPTPASWTDAAWSSYASMTNQSGAAMLLTMFDGVVSLPSPTVFSNPLPTTAITNQLRAANIVKSYGGILNLGPGISVNDGFNVASVSNNTTSVTITFASAMAGASYTAVATVSNDMTASLSALLGASVTFRIRNSAGALVNPNVNGFLLDFIVIGKQ